ncbi:EAL domain-containing protein [Varunaivibrio sulfuroxidans]|uniref:PAS domain S-box-containing protein/diguanylate cyclase (GGDEF)-like protein n=1 Tax=Varunaivibrio sulfuroxidans TaxID=1773489 RepID=A0A4R3J9U7_9PROT|nr:EAL domain-containing protein [Varunaivibrio sulfuroxidans]TCS62658.1 PAS domain S-box-containing protein/diguanylate cyclase (GGDEF)-like protein [Varunaivibrio sulfuroxidans]WES30676.1 EAL domain-containing protein [Varunaivibrio sulfuroxidans]
MDGMKDMYDVPIDELTDGGARPFEFLDHIGQGIAVFGADRKLKVFNRAFYRALDILPPDISVGMYVDDLIRQMSLRGDYGPGDPDGHIGRGLELIKKCDAAFLLPKEYDGADLDGVINALSDGGFVIHYEKAGDGPFEDDALTLFDLVGQEFYAFNAQTLLFSHVNKTARRNLGYALDELRRMTPLDLMPTFTDLQFRQMLGRLLEGEKDIHIFETVLMREDETLYPVEVHLQHHTSGGGGGFIAAIQDVTDRKEAEKTIWQQANYDSLTGLPNRAVFFDRLEMAQLQGDRDHRMVALHFLDLDFFKDVNDSEGHGAGDALLVGVAKKLKSVIRKTDTVARLGGDEFAVIQPSIRHVDDAELLAKKILKGLSEPFQIGAKNIFIGGSIGITVYPLDDQNPEELLRNADIAMYEAKSRGRNTFAFYDINMSDIIRSRNEMEQDLRRALENKEFYLLYQPKVLSKDGEIVGMEALIRWNHPERGNIPPSDFIPLAEKSGLIVPIGEWVLRTAASQNKAWQDMGLKPLGVAVNLSAVQFRDDYLVGMVADILDEVGLDPQYLELEITESTAMDDASKTADILDHLTQLGVKISLDDFGTGYSSLAYLKRFPLDRIKIDMSFVRDIISDGNDAAIVNAVINLGRALDMMVTAEGVETQAQLAHLSANGCDEVQGFYFSRPVSAEQFPALLLRGKI